MSCFVPKNGHQKDLSDNEIGLHAQCIATNISPIENTMGKTFVIT